MSEEGPDLSCFDFGEAEAEALEGREAMLKRHRKEEQAVRTEAKARKHAIHKADRAARAAADAALEAALEEMRRRHAAELRAGGGGGGGGGEGGGEGGGGGGGEAEAGGEDGEAAGALGELSLQEKGGGGRGKAGKRRAKKEEAERERERRIAACHSGAGPSEREVEMQQITEQLTPLGLRVVDIAADGHCLYRSISHQLGMGSEAFAVCRHTAAEYIRSHPDDFLPYIAAEGAELGQFCDKVATSNEWGGQLEITALANAHKRCVHIYSADAPVLVTCPQFEELGPKVLLAYHKHYYGLGAHYNAVAPA